MKYYELEQFVEESNMIEGLYLDHNDRTACIAAHEKFLKLGNITVKDLENFVSVIQPGATLRRKESQNVRVGGRVAPYGGPAIEKELELLLRTWLGHPYQMHIRYQHLHPFTDGNGRSGRVLWLWQMDDLDYIGFLHGFYYQTLKAFDVQQGKN